MSLIALRPPHLTKDEHFVSLCVSHSITHAKKIYPEFNPIPDELSEQIRQAFRRRASLHSNSPDLDIISDLKEALNAAKHNQDYKEVHQILKTLRTFDQAHNEVAIERIKSEFSGITDEEICNRLIRTSQIYMESVLSITEKLKNARLKELERKKAIVAGDD
jgi:hypothetical protein